MVVSEADVKNIMGGMQETSGVRINNKHKLRHRYGTGYGLKCVVVRTRTL